MADLKQEIILVYDKSSDRLNEKSEDIVSLTREPGYTTIRYKGSSRTYKYSSRNVIQQYLWESIDPAVPNIYIDGELQSDIIALGYYDSHYGIVYKRNRTPVYIASSRVKIQHSVEKSVLAYLTDLASSIKDSSEEQEVDGESNNRSFLSSQIKKIIHSDENVLSCYLNKAPIRTNNMPGTLIYPFDVNTSQKEAIRKALNHNISIIQGPPGTGKTQSILNLIANLVCQGKSIGIVSNNNSAIENVKHKLDKAGYGFLVAHLGNNENKKRFFESVSCDYEPDPTWRQESRIVKEYYKKLARIEEQIDSLLQAKEELAKCKETLPRLKREQQSFHNVFGKSGLPDGYDKLLKWSSDKLTAFKAVINYFPERTPFSKLFLSLSFSLKFGHVFFSAKRAQGSGLCLALDSLIYDKKIGELELQIQKLGKYLAASDLKELLRTCSELSVTLFRYSLYERYSKQKSPNFTLENYSSDHFASFVGRFPVILSTTHSILGSVLQPLDYIIIDESSQVDVITASLAFSACRNVVIVGDEQQLPHIVTEAVKEKAEELAKRFRIPPEYDYVQKNIIASLNGLYGDSMPKTLLREHYRCNPLIIGFCNQKYYQGKLIVMKDEPARYDASSYPVRIFRTAEGIHGRNKMNERQIAVIRDEVLPECNDVPQHEIGIISPYRNQADEITRLLCKDSGMESDTIHKFQGREKKKVIFSTVSNEITEFMDKAELINVAVSRAIDQFIMVMPHSYELTHGSNIGDLIRYIEHWNPYGAVDSRIVSYFDLLQPAHSKSLDDFKKKIKGNSRFESENIIEELINSILAENPSCSGFYVRRGYPLYLITPNKEGLNQREADFSNNRLSHVDFLIVNRCDNSFVLAIEVDGYTYHSKVKQQERDAIKNKVLALNGIELLRLSTRGYEEADKIREKLQAIIS
ncbi:AAA domain-containing protein [Alistipes sp. OttesenSCG-928-B03]|nr:AAA domain-containing protein [Alistipes sp. OttesenSCG-928-B03]